MDESKAVNVGVAAHITAASAGGPRYDPTLSPRQRSAPSNAIWVCQTCAKLIDSDPNSFPVALLKTWKTKVESEAARHLGKARRAIQKPSHAVQQKRRELDLRDLMRQDLLKPFEPHKHARELFRCPSAILHTVDDTTYPNSDGDGPGISPWFKAEFFDFYHNGIVIILWLYAGLIDDEGHWCIIEPGKEPHVNMPGFKRVKIWHLGKIPFRIIEIYDPVGDEYYPGPHVYCSFDKNREPYGAFEYRLCGSGYEPLLPDDQRIEAVYRHGVDADIKPGEVDPECTSNGPREDATQ